MYERNPRVQTWTRTNFCRPAQCLRMGLHHLSSQGYVDLIHGGFKTARLAFGKKDFAGNMHLHFHHLVVARLAFFDAKEHLATLHFVVEGQQLVQLGAYKRKQTLVGVEMDGVDLDVHAQRGCHSPVDR